MSNFFPKNKEYITFCYYDESYGSDENDIANLFIASEFDFIGNTISSSNWRLLDLKQIRDNCDSHIKYLILYDKYMCLQQDSDDNLTYDKEGFQLYGKTFQSLSEVKRAIKLKAFS